MYRQPLDYKRNEEYDVVCVDVSGLLSKKKLRVPARRRPAGAKTLATTMGQQLQRCLLGIPPHAEPKQWETLMVSHMRAMESSWRERWMLL